MSNCHLAFAILASSIVAGAVALVLAALVTDKKPKKKSTVTGNAKTLS